MKQLYHPRRKEIDAFIFKVTVSENQLVRLPLLSGYLHDFWVSYGDGTKVRVTGFNDADASHRYAVAGEYTVRIRGLCQSFAVNNSTVADSIRLAITEVIKWGTTADFRVLNFYGCANLAALPHDESGMTAITGAGSITTFLNFARGCTSLVQNLDDRLFSLTPGVTSFESSFESSGVFGIVPVDMFRENVLVTTFKRTFWDCDISGECHLAYGELFRYNTLNASFEGTFAYTLITGNVSPLMFTWAGANVITFRETFRNTSLGSAGEVLPWDIFLTNVNAISFNATFYATRYSCTIPLLFTCHPLAQDFTSTFAATPFSGVIPVDLFVVPGTSALYFSGTFASTSVSGIPDHLFWTNVNATHFNGTFSNCYGLSASNGGLGYNPINNVLFSRNIRAITFAQTFWDDYGITIDTLPEEMFWNNTLVTSFYGTLAKVNITYTVPRRFFWYCPLVTDFGYTFYQGGWGTTTLQGDLDPDLFIYNPLATYFGWIFRWRHGVRRVPSGLFRANLRANNFHRCLQCGFWWLEQYVFSDSSPASALSRFRGITPDFSYMFEGGGWTYITLDVAPSVDWVEWDTVTGQTSGASVIIHSKLDATRYYVKNVQGTFTLGEVVGVTNVPEKLADQGASRPIIQGFSPNYRYAPELWDGNVYDMYQILMNTYVRPTVLWAAGETITGQSSGASCTLVTDQTTSTWGFYVKELQGTFIPGEVIGVTGVPTKLADQGTNSPTFSFNGRRLNLDVAPSVPWILHDVVTGQTSGATCEVLAKVSDTAYVVRGISGTFVPGETIGVAGNPSKQAGQGAVFPTITYAPAHNLCYNGTLAGYSNYVEIPADWRT